MPNLTRRHLIAAGLSLAAATQTSPAIAQSTGASPTSGEWTFTDDRGVTITLPQRPERVVAYVPLAAGLWDVGYRVVGVYGTLRRPDGSPEIYAGAIDFDAVESLGETYGEIDLEKLVALQPDLIIFDLYSAEVDLWGLPEDAVAQVEDIAPILGISFVERPVTDTIGRLEELAGALGADLTEPAVTEARTHFDQASADVQAACADKPNLSVLAAAGWTDNLYIANAPLWADLIYFRELGLDLITPDVDSSELWETLSWEQAAKYPADLILNDARSAALPIEQLAEIPTWNQLPAVQAGQVGAWHTEFVPSHAGFAAVLESLAATVRASRPDVV